MKNTLNTRTLLHPQPKHLNALGPSPWTPELHACTMGPMQYVCICILAFLGLRIQGLELEASELRAFWVHPKQPN